jgi:hypothetical protein
MTSASRQPAVLLVAAFQNDDRRGTGAAGFFSVLVDVACGAQLTPKRPTICVVAGGVGLGRQARRF